MIFDNILFVHIPKTGGTCIEDELLEMNKFNCPSYLKNYFLYKKVNILKKIINKGYLSTYVFSNVLIRALNNIKMEKLSQTSSEYHYTLNEYINNDFYKPEQLVIVVVRNPLKRVVSLYNFIKPNLTFKEFVKSIYDKNLSLFNIQIKSESIKKLIQRLLLKQVDYIKFDKKKYPDLKLEILKQENLDDDWLKLCNKYDFHHYKLKKINVSSKSQNHKIKMYDDDDLKLIKEIYKEDYKVFGYN